MADKGAPSRDTTLVKTIPADSIVCAIAANGYESHVTIPLSMPTDEAQAEFVRWFEMQLDFFKRWQPGMAATIRETRPAEVSG